MAVVVFSLGSNKGDRKTYLSSAINMVSQCLGEPVKASSIYESEPWGFNAEIPFLNQVAMIESHLSPSEILKQFQKIEVELGRTKKGVDYQSRTIDLDLLFYDDLMMRSKFLTIPHPEIQNRKFILVPLLEITPDYTHPIFKKSIQQLFDDCSDKLWVKKYVGT